QYGIASLTALPHLILTANLEVEGVTQIGIASEGLPPKWFTKNPNTHFREDLPELFDVIEAACEHMMQAGACASPFELWKQTYEKQRAWGNEKGYPSLLWAFGVSLAERALIDGYCKAMHSPFNQGLHKNQFGIELDYIHPELAETTPATWLPKTPKDHLLIRHTVGLGDPILESDINSQNRINDGLPQSLEANIQAYGLKFFKIKVCGDKEQDLQRLMRIASLFDSIPLRDYAFTLDGNEQFKNVETFRDFWESALSYEELSTFFQHLLFVEQPIHRDFALSEEVAAQHHAWSDRPRMIIDESDGDLDSLRIAINNGYIGTSHKNCKGVFKGIANACYIAYLNQNESENFYEISGEDLANVGPVALLQDLTLMASLGINHVERNGHHYFKGLSIWPESINQEVLRNHCDLYEKINNAFSVLRIQNGLIDITSFLTSPFGCNINLYPRTFTPFDDWSFDSLEIEKK
ncbi:hypothetical protein K8I31_15305, partial [bacterium]|nr:hypothetical protein [bacterium]